MISRYDYKIAGDTNTRPQWVLAIGQSGVVSLFTEDTPSRNISVAKSPSIEVVKEGSSASNHNLQDIHGTTDFQFRFIGLNLDYYRKRIPPEQFRLLMDFIGIYSAPGNFDPEELFYPEDL